MQEPRTIRRLARLRREAAAGTCLTPDREQVAALGAYQESRTRACPGCGDEIPADATRCAGCDTTR